MAYLPVSLPSVHKLISCPHWSCARSCVLEEGLWKWQISSGWVFSNLSALKLVSQKLPTPPLSLFLHSCYHWISDNPSHHYNQSYPSTEPAKYLNISNHVVNPCLYTVGLARTIADVSLGIILLKSFRGPNRAWVTNRKCHVIVVIAGVWINFAMQFLGVGCVIFTLCCLTVLSLVVYTFRAQIPEVNTEHNASYCLFKCPFTTYLFF